MAFDRLVLEKVVDELKDIIDYKVDKIYQPDKNTLILGLYGNFTNVSLLACISSNNYRIHLTTHLLKNPAVAPNFCMLLRKHILGYKIKNIYAQDFERIVFIEFENNENPNKSINKILIVELMGKHSNLILTDENGVIIDSVRHTSVEENAQRDIYPTARYILPAPSCQNVPNSSAFENFINTKNTENDNSFYLNFALDDFYFSKESKELFTNSRNSILSLILATLKKYEKRLYNIDNKLLECANRDKFKLYGELITANLYKINSSNISSITVENYYDENNLLEIPLDKRFSPSYNAKRYFKKYTKLKNALDVVSIQKQETLNDINYIESIVYELENCETLDDIEEIYNEISESEIFKSKFSNKKSSSKKSKVSKNKMTSNKFAKFNPLKYTIEGYTIYVGRNNKENDYLTNKFANKNDIWFHTKNIHGSHVILKTNPNEIIPDNILYEAAKLATLHSKAKNSSKVPVDFCPVRFVKKVPGNKPGLVIYTNNQTIFVE